MKPLQFYQKYLSNNDLIPANIGLEGMETIDDLEELAEVLTFRSTDDYFLEVLAGEMTDREVNLIKRLNRTTTLTQYYTMDYKPDQYPILTGSVLLIEDKNIKGVIHQSVVEGLMKFIFDEEEPEIIFESLYLNKLPPYERSLVIENAGNMTLKSEMAMNSKTALGTIISNLNFAVNRDMGQTEELVIYEVLTRPEYMEKPLTYVPYEAITSLQKAVENNDPFFKVNDENEDLFHYGFIDIFDTHAYIFPEVFKTLKKVDLKRLTAITRSGVSIREYNAMRVKVTLKDAHVPIERELIIPARLNFYELHLVIQRAMGWWTSHLARFNVSNKYIHMYGSYDDNTEFAPPGTIHLSGIETMVDGVLIEHGELTYLYDYGDDWEHGIELMELLMEPPFVYPTVEKRKGPIPIEDSGGVHGLEEKMEILNDDSHPEHDDIAMWVKSTNYKKTYQKKQINKKLEALFSGAPITSDKVY